MPLNFPFPTPADSSLSNSIQHPHPADDPSLAEFRHSTNLRSVTRVDPLILEIIDTSVYSVIYQYDEGAASWEKQKQEGPMFVVRREKSPEYALFMLNRQTVRNVTIPLVPGEMKLTVVDTSTLQVARRGERYRRGIWFSEGPVGVERFKQTILRICGLPSKKPDVQGDPTSSSSASPISASPRPGPVPEDSFSRLFAGLMTSAPPNPPSAPTSALSPAPANTTGLPVRNAPAESISSPSLPPPRPSSRSNENTILEPVPVSFTATEPPALESSSPTHSPHPPGQTVNDLLASILGGSASPMTPFPSNQPGTSSIPPRPATPQPTIPTHTQSPVPTPAPAPVITKRSSKVGDATFAEAAQNQNQNQIQQQNAGQSPTTLNMSTNSQLSSSTTHYPYSSSSSEAYLSAQPSPNHSRSNGQGRSLSPNTRMQMEKMAIGEAVGGNMVRAVSRGQVARPGGGGEVEKRQFVQKILELIHTDQGFIDQVWGDYLSRMGEHPPG